MAGIKELLRIEADGSISFGDYEQAEKKKLSDFAYQGDVYKVKTFREMTKLEKNDLLVYESVPGTAVHGYQTTENGIRFEVEAADDAQVILSVEDGAEYMVTIGSETAGPVKTSMGGKLVLSVGTAAADAVAVEVIKK